MKVVLFDNSYKLILNKFTKYLFDENHHMVNTNTYVWSKSSEIKNFTETQETSWKFMFFSKKNPWKVRRLLTFSSLIKKYKLSKIQKHHARRFF